MTESVPPAESTAPTRFTYSTDDPAAAREYIGKLAAPNVPTVFGSPEQFRFRVTSVRLDRFRIQSFEHSMAGRTTVDPEGAVTVGHLLGGSLEFVHGGHTVRVNRGESHLYQAHGPVEVRWSDVRIGVVRLALSEVEELAAEVCGVDAAELRFTDAKPRSPEAERYWQSLVRMVNREILPNEFATGSEIIQESMGRMLGVALLQTFPNTAIAGGSGLTRASGRIPPAALRRAVEYIQENAAEAISMADIAKVARVTPRSLQHGFRRTWDTTPTSYLRQVRLERAHRDLQAADPSRGDTVAAVASRWGFGNVGRFAARYREAYGRTPHEVLRS
ncbi:AraC-type DNA-binding protein [Jatrophihabitans endophyticus]|uniref:AraC-type DNA-binding protein n=1 Tax=Jatrophihabitans endophyticus TaxID=1206085 RepID=A0A1M5DX24_9ACTN|nr:AraC family transcriptional regulator [Jatrophihabitans endophyticus]SHF71495.1 AraC-type DNA-binding protein [Jatrophihabitans endophyticus]